MTKKDSIYNQCENLGGEAITFLENGVLVFKKFNDELRISMGVDPNDDLNTAIKKLNEQADQKYKESKEREKALSKEEMNLYFPSLPDILLGGSYESSSSGRRPLENSFVVEKGKELGNLSKNCLVGDRRREGGGIPNSEGYPPPLRSSMGLGPINAHSPGNSMSKTNSISFIQAAGLTISAPIKTAATVAVVTFKSVEAAASIIADNQERVVNTTKAVTEETLNLVDLAVYGMVKINVETRRNLDLGNKSLDQLRKEAYASLDPLSLPAPKQK